MPRTIRRDRQALRQMNTITKHLFAGILLVAGVSQSGATLVFYESLPVVNTSGTVADVNNEQIQAFFLRNNSVEPASTLVDNLRVGTTWADVTPVPEPAAAVLGGVGLLVLLLWRRWHRLRR